MKKFQFALQSHYKSTSTEYTPQCCEWLLWLTEIKCFTCITILFCSMVIFRHFHKHSWKIIRKIMNCMWWPRYKAYKHIEQALERYQGNWNHWIEPRMCKKNNEEKKKRHECNCAKCAKLEWGETPKVVLRN